MENNQNVRRLPTEQQYRGKIDALAQAEEDWVPTEQKISPHSVLTYITGSGADGVEITPKYIGSRRLVEIAVTTLMTDQTLLPIGRPGIAKSWPLGHLTATINGDSAKVVQGTAGTMEGQIRYSWNYTMLIAQGSSKEAMIKSPMYQATETGAIARLEKISRCASEVQDALIFILSKKRIAVPELLLELPAQEGFSMIATANTRNKGANETPAALKRRFNIMILPPPTDLNSGMEIVETRAEQLAGNLELHIKVPQLDVIECVCTIFRELQAGMTPDGRQKPKLTSGILSATEAISLLANSAALAGSFEDGNITNCDLAAALQGAAVKDEGKDDLAWKGYLENIMMKRGSRWLRLYRECKELNS